MFNAESSYSLARGQQYDEGLRQYMLNVYNYMTFALALTGLVSLGVSMSPILVSLVWATPLKWVVLLAPLGISLFFSFKVGQMTSRVALYWLIAFSLVMGLSMSSLFVIYKLGSIANAFFISAITFGVASLYGYTTKRDLTNFGAFLMMGVIGLVIAGLVNLFLQSSMLTMIVSCLSVLIFTGMTAYETQDLKFLYDVTPAEEREKVGVVGAFNLYVSFINIFVALVQLIGDKKE